MKPNPTINAMDAFHRFIAFGPKMMERELREAFDLPPATYYSTVSSADGEPQQSVIVSLANDGRLLTVVAVQEATGDHQTYEFASVMELIDEELDELQEHFLKQIKEREDNA